MNGYFSFFYKMLKKHLWSSFLLYLVVEILQLLLEKSSFPEVLYKWSVLKNFSKFTDKRKKQSSGGVLSKEKKFLKIMKNSPKKHFYRNLFFNKVADWKSETVRSSSWRCSLKQGVLKNFAVLESLFHKVAVLGACNFIKKDSDTHPFL